MIKVTNEKETRRAISDNLKRLLSARNMSQGDLARKIFGDDAQKLRIQVSRWCNGKTDPSSADLLNLSEALGVSVEEIARPKKLSKIA